MNNLEKLQAAKQLVVEVANDQDCNLCNKHLKVIEEEIGYAETIQKFNDKNDPEYIEHIRKLLNNGATLMLISTAAKIVSFFKRL